MRRSRLREQVAGHLRSVGGLPQCAGCIARALAANEGRVRYTLVLLEGSGRFPRSNGRCTECGRARLVSRFGDAAPVLVPAPRLPARDEPAPGAARPGPEVPPVAAASPRAKCARCSFVIGAAESMIVVGVDPFHSYCWRLVSSARSIAEARRLTREFRVRIEESRRDTGAELSSGD